MDICKMVPGIVCTPDMDYISSALLNVVLEDDYIQQRKRDQKRQRQLLWKKAGRRKRR